MADAVRLRPNHYELLGITPAASSTEIAEAFARELRQLPLRPFGSLAEVSLAYETLRDPIKRVAYDASLRSQPKPAHSLIGRLEGAQSPFLGRAPIGPAKPAVDPAPSLAPLVTRSPEPRDETRTAPSATAMLGQAPQPTPREFEPSPRKVPQEIHRPTVAEKPRIDLQMESDRPLRRDSAAGSIGWKLPAFAAGALILAVTLGAWTGWEAGNDNDQAPPDRSAMLKIPPAKTATTADASPADPPPALTDALPEQRVRRAAAKKRIEGNRSPLTIELPEQASTELAQGAEAQPQETAGDQVVAEAPSVAATAAKLPLPKAVIARTIGRIGYACGQVASATAIEGDAPGVFKVTCTSGHSYRAAPVRGRYHFRRLGGR
jgi:hypothetical protein